jgi:hypothetical protein
MWAGKGRRLHAAGLKNLPLHRIKALVYPSDLLPEICFELREARKQAAQLGGKLADGQFRDLVNFSARDPATAAASTLAFGKFIRPANTGPAEGEGRGRGRGRGGAHPAGEHAALQRMNSIPQTEDFIHELRDLKNIGGQLIRPSDASAQTTETAPSASSFSFR